MSDIKIPKEIWEQIEATSKECRSAWGMGFDVISISLLKKILKREVVTKPKRSISHE